MRKWLILLAMILPILACNSCDFNAGSEGNASGFSVDEGEYTGRLAYTETRVNGTMMVWPALSIDAVFCIFISEDKTDKRFLNPHEKYKNAQKWRRAQEIVNIKYESINAGDPDGYSYIGFLGCDSEAEGVQTYRLLSIELATPEPEVTPEPESAGQ